MKLISLFITLGLFLSGCTSSSPKINLTVSNPKHLPHIVQELVIPPFLPKHNQIAQGGPKIVHIQLVVEEKELDIGNGAKIQALTYNGSIPGPAIVVHQDDYVELTLVNPSTNSMAHNIDFHAATGAMGGGELSKVKPGEKMVLRFKATKPGVFVYHCATGGPMIPYHVVSGMNGMIMVLPREGLKDSQGKPVHYDRAYYIGEQDFYLAKGENGAFQQYNSPHEALAETLPVMSQLIPSHVVFNGAVGALTKDHALKAKVGEKVLFIHSQANRDTRPHLIGGHGELVWETGSFSDHPASNLETWFIRGGSAGAMIYEFKQPGTYAYVNHNLIEAILLGAAAHIKVEGEWNHDLMTKIEDAQSILKPINTAN